MCRPMAKSNLSSHTNIKLDFLFYINVILLINPCPDMVPTEAAPLWSISIPYNPPKSIIHAIPTSFKAQSYSLIMTIVCQERGLKYSETPEHPPPCPSVYYEIVSLVEFLTF